MTQGQVVPALMAALMGQGVRPRQIELAVMAVRDCKLGTSIASLASPMAADQSMVRAFIHQTTRIYRPGPEIEETPTGWGGIVEIWVGTPHESEAVTDPDLFPSIDVHFFRVSVSRADAEALSGTFYDVMEDWPVDPTYSPENRLAGGPSYIELGAQIGTFMGQQDAMRLMALGEVLGAWKVITPGRLGLTGTDADRAAGGGYIMVTPYGGRP